MSASAGGSAGRREPAGEERVEVRRYLDALVRNRWMIAGVVLFITALVVIISLILPNTYTATSRLVFESAASPFGETDSASTERQLATTEALLTSQQVLDRAAARVPGVSSGDDLEDKVSSSVEPEANIVNVSASDGGSRRSGEDRQRGHRRVPVRARDAGAPAHRPGSAAARG